MQASLTYIRKELAGSFPKTEVESFIRIIFSHLRNYNSTDLILQHDEILTEAENDKIKTIVSRLKQNEPIQYILGETEFFGSLFKLSSDVLIPRPETEELVDWILKSKLPNYPRILDVGTGSGCIPITIKKNIPEANVSACDIQTACLVVAKKNAIVNQVELNFFEMDILNPIVPASLDKLDLIVSNPPYVTNSEKKLMEQNVLDFEPETALFVPDENPLKFYKALTDFGVKYLKKGGSMFWEINEAFGKECVMLLEENDFSDIELRKDLNGKDRMIKARKTK